MAWRTAGTVMSILIAVAAAGFTGLQWYEAHQQLLLSMKPSVDFDTEDDPESPPIGIAIRNEGPGPAIVQSLKYHVDRKQVKDLAEAATDGNISSDQIDSFEFDPDDTLAVGEKEWLVKYHKPRGGQANPKDADHFADFINQRLAIQVEFCSVMGDCWIKCSKKDQC